MSIWISGARANLDVNSPSLRRCEPRYFVAPEESQLRLCHIFARICGRKANRFLRRAALAFETLLSRTEHPQEVLAGIIASWVLVGTINILMHKSEADAQLAPQNVAYSQLRSCTTTAATWSYLSTYSKSSTDRELASDLAFSIVNFQLAESVHSSR